MSYTNGTHQYECTGNVYIEMTVYLSLHEKFFAAARYHTFSVKTKIRLNAGSVF